MAVIQSIREEVKAKNLPAQWRKKIQAEPDQIITVVLQPRDEELTQQLLHLADEMTREAKQKGLTEEKLNQLLSEPW